MKLILNNKGAFDNLTPNTQIPHQSSGTWNTECALPKRPGGVGLAEIQLTFHSLSHGATIHQEERMFFPKQVPWATAAPSPMASVHTYTPMCAIHTLEVAFYASRFGYHSCICDHQHASNVHGQSQAQDSLPYQAHPQGPRHGFSWLVLGLGPEPQETLP